MDGRRISDIATDQRPRERLERLGREALTDAEVVAILISSGRSGANAIDIAQLLLSKFDGMSGLSRADIASLQRVSGIGLASASRIIAGCELHRRFQRAKRPSAVTCSADIAELVMSEFVGAATERIVVAIFDSGLALLDVFSISEGAYSEVSVPTSVILRKVLTRRGAAFAVAHNHPSGSVEPSSADRLATSKLFSAADACGLRFLGHLIVAGESWTALYN